MTSISMEILDSWLSWFVPGFGKVGWSVSWGSFR